MFMFNNSLGFYIDDEIADALSDFSDQKHRIASRFLSIYEEAKAWQERLRR